MALIEMETPPINQFHAVEAGDAAEMVSRLTNEAAAAATAQEGGIVDFVLAGAGSGPQWQAWFVAGTGAPVAADFSVNQPQFVAAVAGNPVEALFYLKQRLAAAIGDVSSVVFKVEVAGAGDGPSFMAVAMFGIPTPPS